MRNENYEQKMSLLVPIDEGFESDPDDDRLIKGSRLVCIDGAWTIDEVAVPPDERFIMLNTFEAVQHWQNGELVEQIIKKPGVVLPDVGEENKKIPQEEWDQGDAGLLPPWAHQYGAYLIRLSDGSIVTHINKTNGTKVAINSIRARVRWERNLRGSMVLPIVLLGKRLVSRQYKKLGPLFVVVDWHLGRELAAQTTPRQLEKPAHEQRAVEDVEHSEPAFAEIIDEDKTPIPPQDDYQPVGEPVTAATPKAPASSPPKPAVQKPQTTKKGVQKVASGRGR
jgi:hypothetical protein